MEKIKQIFTISKDVMKRYRKYCSDHGLNISKRIEILMEKELWKAVKNNRGKKNG